MPSPLTAAAFFAAVLAAAPAVAGAGGRPPASDADRVAAFLLHGDSGARSFVADGANEAALGEAARAWSSRADKRRVVALASAAIPGSSGEGRLVRALSDWTGAGRIAASREKDGAMAFLEAAAEQAEKLLGNPAFKKEVDAAAAGFDQSKAVERARQMSGRGVRSGTGVFGSDRNPGAIGDDRGGPGDSAPPGRVIPTGSSNRAGGAVAAGGMNTATSVNPSANADSSGMSASSFRPALPANFKKPNVVPPLAEAGLTTSDRVINKVLSVANMESFSRKDTLNRESAEGTQSTICKFLIRAKYDPDEAWGLSLAARNAPGADPGDLDLRNAEHYLYAYSTTAKPNGWGDSTAVQMLMAVGWTPFKTVTKHVRPTSKPSLEEAKWGIKGAWHGQHPPDWRATCEGAKK